ncbi:MAG: hypothetical protein R3324_14470, partial [Halobacteriales archaeon]|nr:hypothetical protein [Halobacteriales archaeon]
HPTTAGPGRTPSHTESPAGSPTGPFDGVRPAVLVLGTVIVLAVLLLGGRRWWRGRRIDQDTIENDESTDC